MSLRLFSTHLTSTAAIAVVALALHSPAAAQSGSAASTAPALTFVGVGIGTGDDDANARLERPGDSPAGWLKAEAGARLTRVVGVGVEVSAYPELRGDYQFSLGRVQVSDRQRELLIAGLARAQTGFGRQAVALVVGAGVLRQTRDGSYSACDNGCISGETVSPNRTSPAFVFGADYAMRLAPHVDVAAGIRLHMMRRGTSTETLFQFANSTPIAVSLSLRIGR